MSIQKAYASIKIQEAHQPALYSCILKNLTWHYLIERCKYRFLRCILIEFNLI